MKFSILTPSYNSAKYIESAIQSVVNQDYKNWEHIIIDGGSHDGTVEVLKKHPHLNWLSEPDKGQSDAMNKAFSKATGNIIIYLNADDEFAPNALTNFFNAFNANPNCDMVVGNLKINNKGNIIINDPSVNLRQILNYWPCIFPANPVSYAYKKTLQYEVGNFPVNNHYVMDYWFLLRALLKGNVIKEDFIGGTFNFDGTNKSADGENSKKWLKRVRNQFLCRYFFYPQVARFIIRKLF